MNEKQKDFIRTKLLNSRKRTIRRVEQLIEDTAPIAPDCSIGRVSRMDAINNKGVSEAYWQTPGINFAILRSR
ncbi:MAG: hypothetical protein U5L09_11085 [Bacteroidales bacterium]|nr:hypothetical protein [Bacteroidales bacterium]